MDIVFKCPHCEQELEVESTEAGREIDCPSCGEKIVIPAGKGAPPPPAGKEMNAIKSSAAAKEEVHLKVPIHDKPAEKLIAKALKPLDVAAKEGIRVRVKTIRRVDCLEVGHDRFDEIVTGFLDKVGESNIISINTIGYTTLDIATQKILTDFGVIVVYKG
jgi:DNA-directed RNA polymerase subunit RPC12/RpoP